MAEGTVTGGAENPVPLPNPLFMGGVPNELVDPNPAGCVPKPVFIPGWLLTFTVPCPGGMYVVPALGGICIPPLLAPPSFSCVRP